MGKRGCHLQLYIAHLLHFFSSLISNALCPSVLLFDLIRLQFPLTFVITCQVHIPTLTICTRLMTYLPCRRPLFYLSFHVVQFFSFHLFCPHPSPHKLTGNSGFFCTTFFFTHQAQNVCGSAGVSKPMGTLLYSMTSRLKDPNRLGFLTDNIAHSKIITELQLAGTRAKHPESHCQAYL